MTKQTKKNISHAFWESDSTGLVILSRDWSQLTAEPPLFIGPSNDSFTSLECLSPEDCGRFFRYYRRKNSWIFTLRAKRHPELLDQKSRVFLGSDFNQWSEAIGNSRWELKPTAAGSDASYELRIPVKQLPEKGISLFKFVMEDGTWLDVPDSAPNMIRGSDGISNFQFIPEQSGRHVFRFTMPVDREVLGNEKVIWRDSEGEEIHELPHTQFLTSASTTLRLGAFIKSKQTIFRLFAPRATEVKVSVATKLDLSDEVFHPMSCVDGVTWEAIVDQELDGAFYTFRVEGAGREGTSHFDGSFSVLDPYARACLTHRGPGIVISDDRFRREKPSFQPHAWQDMVILESHVRDLAAHAPISLSAEERRGYSGLRKWLKSEGSYLKELGFNTLELQPIQEFDNRKTEDYHWGYMTANYFSPESSYALKPSEASQIEEFRGLINDCHDAGLSVIVDVVYNHVGEPNHLLFIDKFYYFHLDNGNDLMNWSGCGNDLRCDTPMARRLIIESLIHLVEAYDIDGFRFDLAELIGVEVLTEIEERLKAVKPSIVLIAEPWSFRGHIQDELKETGFASWNDGFRESVAKYVRGEGSQELIHYFLAGSPSSSRFAAQTINYTESHDDHCWLDRITECSDHDGSDPTVLDRRRTHLMAAFLFASIGVPMISAGQDFLRSKRGVSNTYQRGDLNALDYNRRFVFSGTHAYFQAWIQFRLSDQGKALRVDGALPQDYMEYCFTDGSSAAVVLYNAKKSIRAPRLIFAINPHHEYANILCPDFESFELLQIADQERFDVNGLSVAKTPIDDEGWHLPPLSCGLWLVHD